MKVKRNGLFDIEVSNGKFSDTYHFHLQSDADKAEVLLKDVGVRVE